MASKPDHVDADRKNVSTALEAVIDLSGKLLCYNLATVYNQPDRRSRAAVIKDAADSIKRGRIPFLTSQGVITGYSHFDDEPHEPTFVNPFELPG
jgi:hypothetical protein